MGGEVTGKFQGGAVLNRVNNVKKKENEAFYDVVSLKQGDSKGGGCRAETGNPSPPMRET